MKDQIKQLESTVFNNCVTQLNELFGTSKTSFLATSILLKLHPTVILTKAKDLKKIAKNSKLPDFADRVTATYNDDELEIHYLYNSDKDIDKLVELTKKHSYYISYLILREVIIILNKYNTSIFRQELITEYSNYAEANLIVDIKILQKAHTFMRTMYNTVNKRAIFERIDEVLVFPKVTTLTKLKAIKLNKTLKGLRLPVEQYPNEPQLLTRFYKEEVDVGYQSHEGNKAMNRDVAISNLAELLQFDISTNCKGTEIGSLLNVMFESVTIDVSWFKKFKRNIKSVIYNKISEENRSWAKLNSMKRHIYSSPQGNSKKFKLDLIVSIDQSASMSTKQLQEILSVFEQKAKHIAKITVITHTSAVLNQFIIEDNKKITNDPQFKEALATRHGTGGTSHLATFKAIQALNIKNPSKAIYMSFSDNYSDIEDVFYKYSVMKEIQCFWISRQGDKDVDTTRVPGVNIKTQ